MNRLKDQLDQSELSGAALKSRAEALQLSLGESQRRALELEGAVDDLSQQLKTHQARESQSVHRSSSPEPADKSSARRAVEERAALAAALAAAEATSRDNAKMLAEAIAEV